jgi:hypothetical protein
MGSGFGESAVQRSAVPRSKAGREARRLPCSQAVALAALICLSLGAADTAIAPAVANLYVGEHRVIEGPVTAARRDGNTVHLDLGTSPQDLAVSLVIGVLSHFPDVPEQYYLGKTVRVSGQIQSFRGVPEVILHDASEIEVIGGRPATLGASAPAPQAGGEMDDRRARSGAQSPAVEKRLQQLGAQVEALERRVQQLERATGRGASRQAGPARTPAAR